MELDFLQQQSITIAHSPNHRKPISDRTTFYDQLNFILFRIILIESFYLPTIAFKSVGNPEIVPTLLFPNVRDSNFQMMIDGRAFETLSRIYFFFTRIHLVIHFFCYVVHKILYMRRMRRGQKSQLHLLKQSTVFATNRE